MSENNKADSKIISAMFFKLLPVQIILVAVTSLNSIIDSAMAGNLIGPQALTALGFFWPVITFMNMVTAILSGGATILCGKFMGMNQTERSKSVFTLDVLVILSISAVLTLSSLLIPDLLSHCLGARGDIIKPVADYLRGYALGFFPILMASQLSSFLQLERAERLTYVATVVMMIMNALLDYYLVGVKGMGLFGLGLATTISNWAFFIIQAVFYLSSKALIRFSLRSIVAADLKDMLSIGFPEGLSQFCQMIRGLFLNYAILRYVGEDGMSAYSAVMSVAGLYFAVIAGIGASSRVLISVYSGEEDRAGLVLVMKTALYKGMALAAVVNLVFILAAPLISGVFYPDRTTEVYALALWGFRLFPISMVLACYRIIFSNCYQCIGRVRFVSLLSVVDGVLGTVATSFLLLPLMGGMGIWITQVLNGIYPVILIILHAWFINRNFAMDTESLMTLGKNMGVPEEDRLDVTIKSSGEVVNVSEKIIRFCKEHHIDERRAYFSGLCFEEMAENIVEHGFDDRKKHSIDIRVVYKGEDELLLRLRDDGRPFNPKEYSELFESEDITHNIGIRMVSRIAKRMEYQNMLGLNVLTIRV
ncbi:MAG: ATP-binding protein [Lachnospiraceae bacterium]|nr:ATP-binding protein [Lachnospiraceae bacterium]